MHLTYKKAYFIGIGGIGMSALAQLMQEAGVEVTGSDRERSPVITLLENKKIPVIVGQKSENVPLDADVVVYTEAVPKEHPERARAREIGIKEISYFGMLGEVSVGKRTVAVAGTHGKTTTTGMLARILRDAGAKESAIVGSIVRDFESNYLSGTSDIFVVEACEYKRDFLTLTPEIVVLTNIELDHTDYYNDLADVQSAFRTFVEKVPAHGCIVTNPNNEVIASVLQGLRTRIVDYTKEPDYVIQFPGEFNQMNARAAAAAARIVLPSISDNSTKESLSQFLGTWRRFENKGTTKKGARVYDDYAHHPTAVAKTLAALKEKTTGKVFVAFHPHLFSRTRDLFEEFVRAFVDADEILIAPIYAAREEDDGSVSNVTLVEALHAQGKNARACSFEEIEHILREEPKEEDSVITMGAGDIYKIADILVA